MRSNVSLGNNEMTVSRLTLIGTYGIEENYILYSDDGFYRRRIFIDAPDGLALRGKSVVWRTSRSRHLRVASFRSSSGRLRAAPRFADPFVSKNHVALVARAHPEKDRRKPDVSSKSSPLETHERISGRIISLSPSFPKGIVATRGNCWARYWLDDHCDAKISSSFPRRATRASLPSFAGLEMRNAEGEACFAVFG
ncbi:PREDICTED: uncharacterized protein LOC105462811 [Wasmannia auropunctata]|uniref:uncharacterized protein LOC105462811 n=1 Tax=Wasmannia auropunctata TaxID=64793 RepID=UPI0005EFBBF7|nr:PREDICTED: uncharacterized protein LOC105462811 [Wasmannia auropunctata]